MKELNDRQRQILTGLGEKFALVAGTSLIFSQFVPNQRPEWPAVVLGSIITALIMWFTVSLNRNLNS